MGNYLLLCHGSRIEDTVFNVPQGSEIVYWGAPGYLLSASVAWTAVNQIRKNPLDLESIGRLFDDLPPLEDRIFAGGATIQPDLSLEGDDSLLCIFINLRTNKYTLLRDRWASRLGNLIKNINQRDNDFVLHLLCCSGDNSHPDMKVLDGLQLTNPEHLIPSVARKVTINDHYNHIPNPGEENLLGMNNQGDQIANDPGPTYRSLEIN